MTSKLIKDYVKVYNNFLDEDTCLATIESLENNEWKKHSYFVERKNEEITYETDLSVSVSRDSQQTMVNNKIWFAIERYILKDIKTYVINTWHDVSIHVFEKYSKLFKRLLKSKTNIFP
jgi:hypothetical protein